MWGSPTCSRRSLSINPNFQKESSWGPRMMPLIHPVCQSYTSQFCPNSNLVKDKIPVLGLDIVERQVQFLLVLVYQRSDHLDFSQTHIYPFSQLSYCDCDVCLNYVSLLIQFFCFDTEIFPVQVQAANPTPSPLFYFLIGILPFYEQRISSKYCQAPTQLPTPSPLQVNSTHLRVELEICPIFGFHHHHPPQYFYIP